MATLTVRKLSFGTWTPGAPGSYAGLVLTSPLDTPIITGDQFIDDGRTFLLCANGATAADVTVTCVKADDDGHKIDVKVPVGANATIAFGPFGAKFIDINGYVQVAYSNVTTIKVAAVSLAEKGRG